MFKIEDFRFRPLLFLYFCALVIKVSTSDLTASIDSEMDMKDKCRRRACTRFGPITKFLNIRFQTEVKSDVQFNFDIDTTSNIEKKLFDTFCLNFSVCAGILDSTVQ